METKKLPKSEFEMLRGLLLANSGLTISAVAKKFKVSRQYAHKVLQGRYSSDKAEAIRDYANSKAYPNRNNKQPVATMSSGAG